MENNKEPNKICLIAKQTKRLLYEHNVMGYNQYCNNTQRQKHVEKNESE